MVSPQQVMAVEWSMLTIAYILVFTRLAVRITLKQKHLMLSDLLLVGGALCALGAIICDTISYRVGAMGDYEMDHLDMSEVELNKLRFAENYLFDVGLYFPKLSMLVIYEKIVPRHDELLRKALYFVIAFTLGCVLVAVFSNTFWCGDDPSVNWSTDNGACSNFTSYSLFRTVWSLCFTCEVLILLLPLPLLFQLGSTLRRSQLAAVTLVFTLGILTLIVSMGRSIATLSSVDGGLALYLWAFSEFSVSIMVVACTALRPVVSKSWRAATGSNSSPFRTESSGSQSAARSPGPTLSYRHDDATEDNGRDLTGSEVELNTLQQGGIIRTECISISSEKRSNDDGLAMEDGACKAWADSGA